MRRTQYGRLLFLYFCLVATSRTFTTSHRARLYQRHIHGSLTSDNSDWEITAIGIMMCVAYLRQRGRILMRSDRFAVSRKRCRSRLDRTVDCCDNEVVTEAATSTIDRQQTDSRIRSIEFWRRVCDLRPRVPVPSNKNERFRRHV